MGSPQSPIGDNPQSPIAANLAAIDGLYNRMAHEMTLPGADLLLSNPAPAPQRTGTDMPVTTDVRNGTLFLRYGDPNMDRQLAQAQNYQRIEVDGVPPNVKVRFWADQGGYFFWFQNGNDNMAAHHYPGFAKVMTVNNASVDIEQQQLQVTQAIAQQAGGFQSFSGRTVGGGAIPYFAQMSKLSDGALAAQEASLSQAVRNSSNPYFKIYLADIYTADAMKPIVQQMMAGGSAELNNPVTVQKLQQAIQLLQAAQTDSTNQLSRINHYPQGNVVMPLDPFSIYGNQGQEAYFGFWGGSMAQAQQRQVALTFLLNLIQNNALPRIELP